MKKMLNVTNIPQNMKKMLNIVVTFNIFFIFCGIFISL